MPIAAGENVENREYINWIESVSRSMQATFPQIPSGSCPYFVYRLTRRLFERLPSDVANATLTLLPDDALLADQRIKLGQAAERAPDLSIGYPSLVEQARNSLLEPATAELHPDTFERIVDFYLWEMSQHLPTEINQRIADNLPVDLRCRLSVSSGDAEGAKVA